MSNFEMKVNQASKNLTVKERFILTHSDDAIKLDKALLDESSDPIVLDPEFWAICDVSNDSGRGRQEYQVIILVDVSGIKYTTGSETFMHSFLECWHALQEIKASGESALLQIYKRKSRNNSGKCFVTCTLI